MSELAGKNRAIQQLNAIKGDYTSATYERKKSPDEVATTETVADSDKIKDLFADKKENKKIVFISAGISIVTVVLVVIALRYKWIKL